MALATNTDPARWINEPDDRLIATVIAVLNERGRNH